MEPHRIIEMLLAFRAKALRDHSPQEKYRVAIFSCDLCNSFVQLENNGL